MSFLEGFRNKILEIAVIRAEKKFDGRELGKKIDEELKKKLGVKTSETLQKTAIITVLKEIIEGLFDDNPTELLKQVEAWWTDLKIKSRKQNPDV